MEMHYTQVNGTQLALRPPVGKDCAPEQYMSGVIEDARIIETHCSKYNLFLLGVTSECRSCNDVRRQAFYCFMFVFVIQFVFILTPMGPLNIESG